MLDYFKTHKYLITTLFIIILLAFWFSLIKGGNYGTTLFFAIPSSVSFLIGYSKVFNGTSINKIKKGLKGFLLIAIAIALISGFLIAIGLEGAICVLMAYPFFVIPMTTSYIIGLFIGNSDKKIKRNTLILIFIVNPTSYIYDNYSEPIQEEIRTALIIDTSAESLWNNISTQIVFNDLPNILFRKGISHPKSIQLKNKENKLSYLCITNNDTLNLDIIKFKTNSEVKFILREQTIPMRELTPYESIDAEHLHNYFFVNYGIIKLEPITANKTKIIATTSYSYKIAPKWYWKLWSNYTIDKMQLYVLNSIKLKHGK